MHTPFPQKVLALSNLFKKPKHLNIEYNHGYITWVI